MAGGDISEFRQLTTADEVRELEQRGEDVLAALENLRVPVVGAIDGAVIGQGALIAACCDILVAGPGCDSAFPSHAPWEICCPRTACAGSSTSSDCR